MSIYILTNHFNHHTVNTHPHYLYSFPTRTRPLLFDHFLPTQVQLYYPRHISHWNWGKPKRGRSKRGRKMHQPFLVVGWEKHRTEARRSPSGVLFVELPRTLFRTDGTEWGCLFLFRRRNHVEIVSGTWSALERIHGVRNWNLFVTSGGLRVDRIRLAKGLVVILLFLVWGLWR